MSDNEKSCTAKDFITLLLIRHGGDKKLYLFEAPPFEHIVPGDIVMLDTQRGPQLGVVKGIVASCHKDADAIPALMMATGATAPLRRALGRVTMEKFTYPDEEKEEW